VRLFSNRSIIPTKKYSIIPKKVYGNKPNHNKRQIVTNLAMAGMCVYMYIQIYIFFLVKWKIEFKAILDYSETLLK
jgi:hypothetical protein